MGELILPPRKVLFLIQARDTWVSARPSRALQHRKQIETQVRLRLSLLAMTYSSQGPKVRDDIGHRRAINLRLKRLLA